MSDTDLRQQAAAGIRKGLELWPDANHWCQDRLSDTAEDGTKQRCTYQMLCEGLSISTNMFAPTTPAYKIADAEIRRVASERGAKGAEGSICNINNNNDFATMKSIVEEAAANLEKVQ